MTLERSKFTTRSLLIAASGVALTMSPATFAGEGRGRDTAPGLNRNLLPEAATQNPGRGNDSASGDLGRTVIMGGVGGSEAESFLRFSNLGTHSGAAQITLRDSETGEEVARWESPSIPGHGALQVSAADILKNVDVPQDASFTAAVRGTFNGQAQHIGWSSGANVVTNLTSCSKLATPNRGLGYVTGLGTSPLNGEVRIVNEGPQAGAVTLVLYDAATGAEVGRWTSPKILAYGALSISAAKLASDASAPVPATTTALTIGISGSAAYMSLSYTEGVDGEPATDLTAGCPIKGGMSDDDDGKEEEEEEEEDEDNSSGG
ncbi:MAG: hypothetical protein AB7I36_01630 [Rhodospirillaceae bacterium]